MADIQFPQWRDEQETNNYPFADGATLSNGIVTLDKGIFLDAALYPIGGSSRMYLSKVEVADDSVTLSISDIVTDDIASAELDLVSPSDIIQLTDVFGRPAGILISEPLRLAALSTFGVGTHVFEAAHTEFVSDVCFPTPEVGVRGIQLDDGTLLTGDVWIIGDDGVILQFGEETRTAFLCSGADITKQVITVHVIGDPLFRRRLCSNVELFATPKFIRTITFRDKNGHFVCTPDEFGDIRITVNNDAAFDTILRVRTIPGGVIFEAVGEELQGVRNI